MLKINISKKQIPVYDMTVKDNHNFFGNDILVHNCSEVFLTAKEMKFAGLEQTRFQNIEDYDLDNGMISLCILGCINFGKLTNITRLDSLTSIFVRFLDNLIDEQEYPMDAAEWPTKGYRFLGIGISDFAHFLAKNDARLGTLKAKELTHKWAERFEYGLIKASNQLAKERGHCAYYNRTKFSDGLLPVDIYNKNVDKLIENRLLCDWEGLRKDIKEYGIRNATLSAIPPTASSSLVSNCQTKDGEIVTAGGIKSLELIMEDNDICYESIENSGVQQWIEFSKPIMVQTRFGMNKSSRIWYNGEVDTKTITFDDGHEYSFTMNHKLLVMRDYCESWVKVKDLKEGDDVIAVNT
jgi:hypothetical protein